MELTKLRTELPFPTRPWEAAKAKFLDGLSQEEWQRFRNATPENLFYDASAAQKRHARGSRSWVLQQKTTSLVEGIAEYGKALDVYSNASSLILCPLWGSIRVVLHIAREAGKFLERLVDMFVSVGDALPRFQIYQIIFPSQERLLRAISDAYLDVIHFCVKAKDFFSSAKGKLIPLSIVCRGMWKPFQQDFDIYMLQFSRHQKRVDKEARVAHMFESARRREAEAARQHEVDLANKALEQRNKKRNKRNQLLMLLRSVDYQAKHRAISRLRHPGTNVWLQSHTTYLSWLSSQGSDCQCCFGIPGSGKSILAASTVDALQPITDSTSILCYYYFDYADKKSLDPEYVLGSLIKQIVVRLDLDYFDDACNNIIEKYSSGSLDDVRHILAGFMKNSSKVYIVLDGLDELDRDGQKAILEMIDFLLTLVGPVVKLFATSRSEEGPVRLFMAKYKSLEMSSADIEDDIKIVVEQTLDSIAKHENTVLQDASIRQEISEALTLGANSMFLWVKFQMYDIREAITESELRATIRNLPRDLAETYARIIQKVGQGFGGQNKIDMMTKVCQWISCARRPLLLTELEEAVGLDETDTHLHRERMATGSGEKLVGACGNLVVYDRDEKTIALAHHTVEQFLTASNPIQGTSGQHSIHFDKGVADHHIGKICIAYLRFTDFERQVYQPEQPVRMARKDAENIIWNRIPLSSSVRRIMSPANTTRRRTEYIFPTPKKGSNLEYTYTMLPYVIEFWLHHSSQFPVDKLNMDAFSHMVLHHRLPFEFRPWNMNKDSSTTPNMASWFPIYVWAMQSCMTSLFYVLFRDADIFAQMQQHFMQRLHGYDLSNHRQEIISQYYLFILSRHHLDSWAMKLSAAADYRESYHMLGLLLTELGKHCPSISTSILGPLFIDALGIAIEKGNFQAAIHIYELYIPDNITLSRLFIEMVDLLHVPAPVITCLLCIPTTDLIEIEDEFLTALKNFLPSLVEVLSISTFADLQLNEWCSSLCLRYTLNVHNDKWLQIVLNHKSKEMVVYPPASWVGSVENIPLARCLIQYYRKIQSENTACGAPMEQNILIKLIDLHPWDRFTVDDFEKADIRGLGWSSQMKMPEVARALTSRYKNHFLDLLVSGFPQDMTAWVFSTRAFNTLLQETSWSSNVVWTFVDYLALRPDINDFPDIMGIFVRLAIGLSPRPPSPQPPSQPSNTNPSPHSMNNRGGAR